MLQAASSKQSTSPHASSDQLVIKLHFSLRLKAKRFRTLGLDELAPVLVCFASCLVSAAAETRGSLALHTSALL